MNNLNSCKIFCETLNCIYNNNTTCKRSTIKIRGGVCLGFKTNTKIERTEIEHKVIQKLEEIKRISSKNNLTNKI